MSQKEQQPKATTKADRQSRSDNWRFYHRSWIYWVAFVLFFLAMLVYLMTEDLRVFPHPQPSLQGGR